MKMEALGLFETQVTIYKSTLPDISEDSNLLIRRDYYKLYFVKDICHRTINIWYKLYRIKLLNPAVNFTYHQV